jgi:hypothetical protein
MLPKLETHERRVVTVLILGEHLEHRARLWGLWCVLTAVRLQTSTGFLLFRFRNPGKVHRVERLGKIQGSRIGLILQTGAGDG